MTKWEFLGFITEEKLVVTLCGEVEVGEGPWWATVRLLDCVLVSICTEVLQSKCSPERTEFLHIV